MSQAEIEVRHDWSYEEVQALFALPFMDLVLQAQWQHRKVFPANTVELCTLLSIKTGACPEDCNYCAQSVRYDTGLVREKLMGLEDVLVAAKQAQAQGATRFCLSAAWRSPKARDFGQVTTMIQEIKKLGLETCVTLGMLTPEQVQALEQAGLDFYNHNLDTSPEYYPEITSTRTYEERLNTLALIEQSKINVCCGGIMGMGESLTDRINFLRQLANFDEHPRSVPINLLVKIKGTPLEKSENIDPFDFVRVIAVARLLMPKSFIRLSAGRQQISDEMHALCFLAGANSIFIGEKLLTTPLPALDRDQILLNRLNIKPLKKEQKTCENVL
jgi:biotin synthase